MQKVENNWKNLKQLFTLKDKERFEQLEKTNKTLSYQCEQMEAEINEWRGKRTEIESNTDRSDSILRREIMQAINKLREVEKQRDDLSESANSGDERGRLLASG